MTQEALAKKIAPLVGHQIPKGEIGKSIIEAMKTGRFGERQLIEAVAIVLDKMEEYESLE